jgi:hypothetical protein
MFPLSLNPLVLVAAGVLCLLIAARVLLKQRKSFEPLPSSGLAVEMPTKWDDGAITKVLQRHQQEPDVLAHVVESIKTRMVLNQDLRIAQQRLKLMAGVIELFTRNKELQGILQDIHLADKDFEIRKIETQMRREDADVRLESERQLRLLRAQRDELHLQKEIVQLKQDIKTAENPVTQSNVSPEQQRRLKRMDIEDKLRDLDRQEEEALETARSEGDRRQIQNMHDDRRQELREQLSKYLV